LTNALLQAGKYIFAEKPISLALDIIDRVDKKVWTSTHMCTPAGVTIMQIIIH
jgi:hypothetical protein